MKTLGIRGTGTRMTELEFEGGIRNGRRNGYVATEASWAVFRLSTIDYRLSTIDYRLSIDFRPPPPVRPAAEYRTCSLPSPSIAPRCARHGRLPPRGRTRVQAPNCASWGRSVIAPVQTCGRSPPGTRPGCRGRCR